MAQLTEHLSKTILARFGLPIGPGALVSSREHAADAADRYGGHVVVKAQVPAGGRGKAGGIKRAVGAAEAAAAFEEVTSVTVDGLRACHARVEPAIDAKDELYFAIVLDGELGGPVLLFGTEGGVEVERATPPIRIPLRPDGTVPAAIFRREGRATGVEPPVVERVLTLSDGMARAYRSLDAQLIEVNPLARTHDGRLFALDARLIVDDHALFRQPELRQLIESMQPRRTGDLIRDRTRLEFVQLDGPLGLISGGAGMTMAVMDLIADMGSRPACFLDCSANPTLEGYGAALDVLLRSEPVKAILISIFGGLTQVDRVAKSLVALIGEKRPDKPVTIRLMGTNVDRAEQALEAAGLRNIRDLRQAVAAAVRSVREAGEPVP